MTSSERVKTLLNRELPDQMGLYEHFWGETLRDYWPEQGYPKGERPDVFFDYDLVGCGGWLNTLPFMGDPEVIEETDRWRITKDGRGATLKHWKGRSGTPEHIGFEVTCPEVWQKFREPLLELNPARVGNTEEAKKAMAEARARGKFAFMGNLFVWELMRGTLGDVVFLPALITDPDWIRDFCQVYLELYKKHYELLFREAGVPDGFFIYEDFGFSNGLFCSPRLLGDLVMPFHRQLVSFLKDYGMPVILHSCGDVRQAVPLVIDAGFDCLQPMEAKAGNNVLEFARTYGNRLSYMGNINVVPLSTNDPDAVRAEIEPKLRELNRMRIPYFFHSDHSIPPNLEFETYQLALRIFREHCRY